jgi:peptidoglycan hydrolase-like protein with peptidoglycan-binding domain
MKYLFFGKRLFSLFFLVGLFLALNTTALYAADYYVSSINANRNDSNAGTDKTKPWATFNKVYSEWSNTSGLIKAGDTIHLERGSTFNYGGWDNITRGGNSSAGYITLRGDDYGDSSKPKAVFNRIAGKNTFFLVKASYIKFIGFTINGNNIHTNAGVLVQTAGSNISNIHVIDITMKNLGPGGTYSNGVYLSPGGGNSISNCLIEGNDISGFSAWGLNEYPAEDAISGSRNNNNIWRDNYIHGFKKPHYGSIGGGIQKIFGGNNNLFENNIIEGDYWLASFMLGNGCGDETGLIIRNNIIKNNRCSESGCHAAGIFVGADSGNSYSGSKLNASIYNNIISGNKGAGIKVANNISNKYWYTGLVNIYNNIISGNSDGTERTDYKGEVQIEDSNVSINLKNNIVLHKSVDVGLFVDDYTGTLNHGNNLFWHSGGVGKNIINTGSVFTVSNAKNYEASAVNSDPLLDSLSLKPKSGSPAIGKGVDLGSAFNKDYNGDTRTSPWDIGAYALDYPPPPPTCTADTWEYSSWSACSSSGTQTCTATMTFDCPSVNTPSEATTRTCTPPTPPPPVCTADIWEYSDWSTCSSAGQQTRTATKTYDCLGANTPSDITTSACTPPTPHPPSCTADTWEYSNWSTCSNGVQTRVATLVSDCSAVYTASEATSRSCTVSSSGSSGGSSGSSSSNSNSNVISNVIQKTYSLSTSALNGTIYIFPNKNAFTKGEQILLFALPDVGYTFSKWSGSNADNTNPLVLSANSNMNIQALFAENNQVNNTLSSMNFTRGLYLGVTDSEVINLQKMLNSDPDTALISSGAGTPGNETSYFGRVTENAVMRFQRKYGIATYGEQGYGVVGPRTRAKLNSLR